MATVTGYTAARMLEIENESIVDGSIVGDNLILIRRDLTQIDAGPVVGPQGPQGDDGPAGADADFGGYVEPISSLGNVSGAVALDFATHNIWKMTPTGNITLSFSNLPSAGNGAPGTLIVANSTYSITWPAGTKFPNGAAPILSGLTIISLFADAAQVYAGVAWSGLA